MKMKNRSIAIIVIVGMIVSIFLPVNVKAYSIYSPTGGQTKCVGDTFIPYILSSEGEQIALEELSLYSSDSYVASVESFGTFDIVKCNHAGKVTITVSYEGAQTRIPLTVQHAMDDFEITKERQLLIGDSASISVRCLGKKETVSASIPLTWASSDPSVVTVSPTGRIKAVSDGVATVTATGKVNGEEIARSCKVTVSGAASPSFKTIKDVGNGLEIVWMAKSTAMKYTLSRKLASAGDSSYVSIYEGNETSYIDTNVQAGKQYEYQLTYQAKVNGKDVTSVPEKKKARYYGSAPSEIKILKKREKKVGGNNYIYIYWKKRNDKSNVDVELKIGKNKYVWKITKPASSGYVGIPVAYFGYGKNSVRLQPYKNVAGKTLRGPYSKEIQITRKR